MSKVFPHIPLDPGTGHWNRTKPDRPLRYEPFSPGELVGTIDHIRAMWPAITIIAACAFTAGLFVSCLWRHLP